jgi:putative sterol carrier protein
MSLSQNELNDLFETMQSKFNAEKADGLDALYQFVLTGDADANYWVHIKDQNADVNEGITESPDTTFIAKKEDYADIVHGRTNAMQSFMQGKLKIKGDMSLAMKLQTIFGL